MRVADHGLAVFLFHDAEGDARNGAVGALEPELAQGIAYFRRRAVHDVKARIPEAVAHHLHEVVVDLENDQLRVGPHPFEDLAADGSYSRPVLDDDTDVVPFDVSKKLFDEKSR